MATIKISTPALEAIDLQAVVDFIYNRGGDAALELHWIKEYCERCRAFNAFVVDTDKRIKDAPPAVVKDFQATAIRRRAEIMALWPAVLYGVAEMSADMPDPSFVREQERAAYWARANHNDTMSANRAGGSLRGIEGWENKQAAKARAREKNSTLPAPTPSARK